MQVPAAHVVSLHSADHVKELLHPTERVNDELLNVWQPTGVCRTSLGTVQLLSAYSCVTMLFADGGGIVATQPLADVELTPPHPCG